jgi:hypothetical protein
MIGLIVAALRSRPASAVTLAILALVATAAAAAGPAYLYPVDQAVFAHAAAAATPAQRTVSLSAILDRSNGELSGPELGNVARALVGLPGFREVSASEFPVVGLSGPNDPDRLLYRQDACDHLIIVDGRCLAGAGETLVGEATARRLGLRPGATIRLAYAIQDTYRRYQPAGSPTTLTVAGTYRVADRVALYWGDHRYFDNGGAAAAGAGAGGVVGAGSGAEPVFADASTLVAMDHGVEQASIDAFAGPGSITVASEPVLRNQLKDLGIRTESLGGSVALRTELDDLLASADRSRDLAHRLIPVAAVPLVALAWFVIFLAIRYGTEVRRLELGVLAMRGTRLPVRWYLAAGELVLPIAVGALAGVLVGPLGVRAFSRVQLGIAGGPLTAGSLSAGLPYALAAAGGAVLAVPLAMRRTVAAPVVALMRRVPGRFGSARAITADVVLVVLAVVAAVQLRLSGGQLVGVGALVPALVMVGCVTVAARAVLPLASRYGARALRRERLGTALGALRIGRQPGSQPLFVVLASAVALLGFAVTSTQAAAGARARRADTEVGAVRVLTVGSTTRQALLTGVRAVDPTGRYAMAVVPMPGGAPGELPKLAVDSTRLAAASIWRGDYGRLSAEQVAARLHPAGAAPMVLRGHTVTLDLGAGPIQPPGRLALSMTLSPPSGQAEVLDFSNLTEGQQTLRREVPECADGCRLIGFQVNRPDGGGYRFDLTVHGLTAGDQDGSTVRLDDAGRWRAAPSARLETVPAGLRIGFDNPNGAAEDAWLQPLAAPLPVPVVSTAPLGSTLAGLDGRQLPVAPAARVAALPRLGTRGALVDLEYADGLATDTGSTVDAQVWLGPKAPADVADRLAAHGLAVAAELRRAARYDDLNRQGPALALTFHTLTAGLAVGLAVGALWLAAAVDRRRREDLTALRVQGVRRETLRRSVVGSTVAVVVAAALAGLLAAAVAWWTAGWAVVSSI